VSTHDAVVDEPDDDDAEPDDDDPELPDDDEFFADDDEPDDEPPHAAMTAASVPAPSRPRASRRETGVVTAAMMSAGLCDRAVRLLKVRAISRPAIPRDR
jgi:hypothetical protein